MQVEVGEKEMVLSHMLGDKVLAYLQKQPFEQVHALIQEILAEARASRERQSAAAASASAGPRLAETVPDGM